MTSDHDGAQTPTGQPGPMWGSDLGREDLLSSLKSLDSALSSVEVHQWAIPTQA